MSIYLWAASLVYLVWTSYHVVRFTWKVSRHIQFTLAAVVVYAGLPVMLLVLTYRNQWSGVAHAFIG